MDAISAMRSKESEPVALVEEFASARWSTAVCGSSPLVGNDPGTSIDDCDGAFTLVVMILWSVSDVVFEDEVCRWFA